MNSESAPVNRRTIDRLTVQTFATRAAMGRAAAIDTANEMRLRLRQQELLRMIFAAAPSQSEMLDALAAAPEIDWRRVIAFHMDEYLGLPAQAPQRFASWLDTRLFSRVPFGNVHRIAAGPDARAAAEDYAALLNAAPVDIICLGIGVNGHIAFNDPPVADFNDSLDVRIVKLDEICRQQQVDDQCFTALKDVPVRALTLTIPRLMRGGRLFCVVPGPMKRAAVKAALHGPVSAACPASILRRHAACTLYLDLESDPDA